MKRVSATIMTFFLMYSHFPSLLPLCVCVSTQSCPALWDPWTVPTRLLYPRDFPGKNTGVGCHCFFWGIVPAPGLNRSLLHWPVDSLPLSHKEGALHSTVWSQLFDLLTQCFPVQRTPLPLVLHFQPLGNEFHVNTSVGENDIVQPDPDSTIIFATKPSEDINICLISKMNSTGQNSSNQAGEIRRA